MTSSAIGAEEHLGSNWRRALSREEVHDLLHMNDLRTAGSIALNWALVATSFAVVALWPNPATVIAALQAEVALLEQRPTLAEVQDARLGSVVLIKDEASGEINFDFNLEETEDLVNWTPVVSGTWTDPGDGGIEVDLPLAPDKRFYRVVVEFE